MARTQHHVMATFGIGPLVRVNIVAEEGVEEIEGEY